MSIEVLPYELALDAQVAIQHLPPMARLSRCQRYTRSFRRRGNGTLWFRPANALVSFSHAPLSPPAAGETDLEDYASDIDVSAHDVFVIEAIYAKATVGRTRFYLIKWDGFTEPTWEPLWNISSATVAGFEREFARFTWPEVTPPRRSTRLRNRRRRRGN
jgi:hypothetical protein